jgi:16S rRNA C967 or C1407 C5-methylase (RsmB/RsmF family)
MEYHDLQKTRVGDLREMMKEHLPEVKGVVGLKKEEIVDLLAEKLGIEKPHKHVAAGLGKRAIKAEIRELKVKREAALEAKESADLKKYRRLIHRRKRRLRRLMQLS